MIHVESTNWKDIVTITDSIHAYVFRGQSDFSWELSTKLERYRKIINSKNPPYQRENWSLTQFKRRAHNIIENPPSDADNVEWLSIIQHHGGLTRMLDFSHSIFVALFFACEDVHKDSAIWFVNYFNLLKNIGWPNDKNIHEVQLKANAMAETLIGNITDASGILPVEPYRLNERMTIQKGLFLMPKQLEKSFMENICSQCNIDTDNNETINIKEIRDRIYSTANKPDVMKLRIKETWKPEILQWLDKVNINAQTLFPGLDGFARSLNTLYLTP